MVGGGHGGGQLGWTHLGLGDAATAEVRVIWPDGEVGPVDDASPRTSSSTSNAARRTPRLDAAGAMRAATMTGRPARDRRPAGLRHAGERARAAGRRCTPARRAAARAGRRARLRPPGRLRRPRAQRQPLVPDGVRPAVRGGPARRRAERRRPRSSWATSAGAWPAPRRCPMERHRYQDFSLPSQPRDRSRPLAEILAGEGIGPGSRVGVVGWKPYDRPDRIELPGVHRRRAARAGRADRPRRERQRPAHRPGRRAADHQRGRPARDVRVGRRARPRAASGGCSAACARACASPTRSRCWAGTGCRCRAT